MLRKDTIAAIATGLTDSGVGIIRISGENAVQVGNSIFRTSSGRSVLKKAESHKFYHGFVVGRGGNTIDEVMAVVMRSPRSYTGEDTVEIQCHGGVLVMKKILGEALEAGARLAEPGEFTKRAFLNGRMDLSRAEAVIDVIHSQNEYALSSSVNQLRGVLSEKIRKLREAILYEIAFIESALDDPEHMNIDGYGEQLNGKINQLIDILIEMLSASDNGRILKEGIRTVIVGKPNAGKSSLLNLMVGEERAIVTEIAGTTRDVIQEMVSFHGMTFHIIDTAGIRDTQDIIEKIGVELAKKYAMSADLVLYVIDTSVPLDDSDREIISIIRNKNVICLMNKSDLAPAVTKEDISAMFGDHAARNRKLSMIRTSTRDGVGMEEFQRIVQDMFYKGKVKTNNQVVIANMRHQEAMREALESLELVQKTIQNGMPEDFYSIDLMNAYKSLGRILGEEVDDDLVEEIFSRFCIGK